MWVIRLVLTVIVLVLLLLIGLVMHVITWIVGRFDQAACLRMRSGYMRLALKLLWVFGGGKATVIGTENIPTDSPDDSSIFSRFSHCFCGYYIKDLRKKSGFQLMKKISSAQLN